MTKLYDSQQFCLNNSFEYFPEGRVLETSGIIPSSSGGMVSNTCRSCYFKKSDADDVKANLVKLR